MKNTSLFRRILSLALVIAMLGSFLVPVASAESGKVPANAEELTLTPTDPSAMESRKLGQTQDEDSINKEDHALTDVVRVSIVLEKPSTLGVGFRTENIARSAVAKAYRKALRADQKAVTAKIEKAIGGKLDVKWNLTLAANNISANVLYGQIDSIKAVEGVKDVFLENRYEPQTAEKVDEPNNGAASYMIGSNIVWANGFTGAGSKVAVIDTGADIEHQSFSGEGLEYALAQNAEAAGLSYEEYVASLNLLTPEAIAQVADQLNSGATADKAYFNTKVGYGYNYVDRDYDIVHINDGQGEHGSHVSGISTANRFIKVDGEFKPALEAVGTQGVAPDAQLVVMKVFGKAGGAYDSDYMVAIEDAIILGCDSANLSLGSGSAGFSFADGYEKVMNELVENGMVVSFSAGNSYGWYDTPYNGDMYPYLYADDVNYATGGSPGTFTNALTVASVNNVGQTGMPMIFGDLHVFFSESTGYGNEPILTLAGKEYEYVLVNGPGVDDNNHVGKEGDQFYALGSEVLNGKIAMCYRGSSSFFAKANAAAAQGAAGVIIINNAPGTISMDLTGYKYGAPVVSILKADGDAILAQSEQRTDANENVYYTGSMSISGEMEIQVPEISDTVEVSAFSSWGTPGTLVLKPEILAPGGSIYSVNGLNSGGGGHDAYEIMSGTSMASPQVAGMAAIMAQYIRANDLCEKTGLTQRQLINSLLMSTSHPVYDANGNYWPVIRVGSGLANVSDATSAKSFILMDETATMFPDSAKDGKVKAELGDDPDYTGEYSFSFTVNPIEGQKEFTLRTDIFTQNIAGDGGYGMLQDQSTLRIGADVTYEVNGETYEDAYRVEADVNKDEVTDDADAQAILDYLTGKWAEDAAFDAEAADVDGDGEITSYDAKLILDSAATPLIPAAGPTKVTVKIKLDDEWKEFLLGSFFTKGFYVEGYTYVDPVADEEGAMDVVHSIPIFGYCGSWTDPAMLDRTSVIDEAYGTGRMPYLANEKINYLTMKNPEGDSLIYMGNPYIVEDEFPADRLAMNSNDTIHAFNYLPIRNIATLGFALQDEEGKVVFASSVPTQRYAPYYNVNAGVWENFSSSNINVGKKLSALGVREGDKVTVGFYALPEYYGVVNAAMNGKVATDGGLDSDGLAAVIGTDILGDGASIKYNVIADDTAPEVKGAFRDLVTGEIKVMASDNNYIAYVGLLSKSGTKEYIGFVPEQTEPGEQLEIPLNLDGIRLPNEVTLLVGDYAGNEVAFVVKLHGDQEDENGGLTLAFTSASADPGAGDRALEINIPELFYNSDIGEYAGLNTFVDTQFAVQAAEYVDGYVFMATPEGKLYAAELNALDDASLVADFSETTDVIYDMAFNYKNNVLYALGANNTVYSVDLITGELTKVAEITVTNPVTNDSEYYVLKDLAIDDDGNFYSANYGSTSQVFLYKFTLDMISEGVIEDLAPVNNHATNGKMGIYNRYLGGGMAWDHNNDKLYVIGNYNYKATAQNSFTDVDNAIFEVNTETGKATRANSVDRPKSSATLYNACSGLIIVPGKANLIYPTDIATELLVEPEEITILRGQTADVSVVVLPWTLTDKKVTWQSTDESVATVKDGVITGVDAGETTVVVTTVAEPKLTREISVKVEMPPDVELRGIIWDEIGRGMASVFNTNAPADWTGEVQVGNFLWGTLVDDVVYASTADTMYAYDADTYEVTPLGEITSMWIPSDAAALPEDLAETLGVGRIAGLCNNGTYFELLDPEAGNLNYWDMSAGFADDPMAVIAYIGRLDYEDVEGGIHPNAAKYLVMTEGGMLLAFYIDQDGYLISEEYAGTSLRLDGASDVTGNNKASMVYDEESNFLFVAVYDGNGEIASVYAIDASDPSRVAVTGDFGPGVWPVVGLYEYEPATDLTLKVNPAALELFETQTAELNIKVKMGETNEYTVEVADPTVCSFEDGVVTALKEGETTITVTTVDVNDADQHLTKTINVLVHGLTALDVTIKGQVTDTNGARFANIMLDGPIAATSGAAAPGDVISGGRGGDLYLADMGGVPSVMDAETFELVDSFSVDPLFSTYPPMDIANYPNFVNAYSNLDTNKFLMTTSIGFLVTPDSFGWDLSAYLPDMAGLAFGGTAQDFQGTQSYVYYLMTTAGILWELDIDYTTGNMSFVPLGDTGIAVSNPTALSMAWITTANMHGNWDLDLGEQGLVVANNEDQTVWFIDFQTGEVGLIGTLDSTNISGLIGSFDDLANVTDAVPENVGTVNGENSKSYQAYDTSALRMARIGDGMARASSSAAADFDAVIERTKVNATANAVVGGTNAARGELSGAPIRMVKDETTAANGNVTVVLTEDEAVTNGLFTVTYDADKLTFVDAVSTLPYKSISHEIQEPAEGEEPALRTGFITIAYASVDEIPAEAALATLNFTYNDETVDTTIVVVTKERNNNVAVDEDPLVIEISAAPCEHVYGEPAWTWNEELTEASAKFVCECGDEQTVEAEITEEVTEPVPHVAGQKVLTAKVTFNGTEYTDTKTVELEALPCPCAQFEDIPAYGTPEHEAIEWAFTHKPYQVTAGTDKTHFSPNDTVTRAQAMVFLWAAMGKPAPTSTENPFVDVKSGKWYTKAILWAVENGITSGTDKTHFSPNKTCNRGEILTFLYAAKERPGYTIDNPYTDVPNSKWYKAAALWAYENGIEKGADGKFAYKTACTRAATVLYIYRALEGKALAE